VIQPIGLLHPGSMGVVLGDLLRAGGARVVWASAGRSARTKARAEGIGIEDLGTVAAVARSSGLVLSICPPEAALDVAEEVMAAGFTGTYVDANAISPERAVAVGEVVARGGASFVDGAVIGPPPVTVGTTRLYLAGAAAPSVAVLFAETPCDARALDGPVGNASALKMSFAAFTKGRAALEAACLALAAHHGLRDELRAEWDLMTPGRADAVERNLERLAPKAWRFGAEMRFIADSFAAAGVPDGFHRAAAEIYERWSPYRGREGTEPPIDELLDRLAR
jgi:3-hydroxyisobutyrate dehydrogenase-like beta-hydroxyacid dehydrogenase